MDHFGCEAERLFRESHIKEAAVVSEELKSDPAKDGLEIGRRQAKLPRAHHAAARFREALNFIGGSGDRLAADPQIAVARNSTEIFA